MGYPAAILTTLVFGSLGFGLWTGCGKKKAPPTAMSDELVQDKASTAEIWSPVIVKVEQKARKAPVDPQTPPAEQPSPSLLDALDDSGNTEILANGLSLAAADSFLAKISGCLSGYGKTYITQETPQLQVQEGDISCLFQLTEMVFRGETFTFDGTESWQTGQSFDKTGSFGTLLNFKIITNIQSPIASAQAVVILFGAAEAGTGKTHAANIQTIARVEGTEPLLIEIVRAAVLVDEVDGAGIFNLILECPEPVIGTGSNAKCVGKFLSNFQLGIGLDTYGESLTAEQCYNLAYSQNKTGIPFPAGRDDDYPNGGLFTSWLKGPAPLFAPQNAHLTLAIAGDIYRLQGCKAWRIAITPP